MKNQQFLTELAYFGDSILPDRHPHSSESTISLLWSVRVNADLEEIVLGDPAPRPGEQRVSFRIQPPESGLTRFVPHFPADWRFATYDDSHAFLSELNDILPGMTLTMQPTSNPRVDFDNPEIAAELDDCISAYACDGPDPLHDQFFQNAAAIARGEIDGWYLVGFKLQTMNALLLRYVHWTDNPYSYCEGLLKVDGSAGLIVGIMAGTPDENPACAECDTCDEDGECALPIYVVYFDDEKAMTTLIEPEINQFTRIVWADQPSTHGVLLVTRPVN